MKNVLILALMTTAAVFGCSQGGSGTDGDDECVGTLDELGRGCPATFDGNLETLPCPTLPAPRLTLSFSCGDLIVLTNPPGTGFTRCNYDAASHALVGAETGSDVGPTCGGRYAKTAGRVAPMSCFATDPAMQQKTCPPT